MITIGFDTSNYTTSVAAYDGERAVNCSRLLKVRAGELGLRQSDALFLHIQNLPDLEQQMFSQLHNPEIAAVGASVTPRSAEGSYMPCFLAGRTSAVGLSCALGKPFIPFSHQQGHLAAVLYSASRLDLIDKTFLAWHLSGGTTELLLVNENPGLLNCRVIGGTTDISAGQIIDRTGQFLELNFPSGAELDRLAQESENRDHFTVKIKGLSFSFSGLENQMHCYADQGHAPFDIAGFILRSVCRTVRKVTEEAKKQYGDLPVVFSGGVSSNTMLRRFMRAENIIFGEPKLSTDNAAGVAVLTWILKDRDGL